MFLGIDGGGTKTTAVLCRDDGTFVHRTQVGSINFYSNPMNLVRERLTQIVRDMMPFLNKGHFDSVFIGNSALNCAASEEEIHALTDGIISADCIGMDSDLYIALEAMGVGTPCTVAICGTGSMVVGRMQDGSVIHRGGFGYLLGDEGSGYAISLSAIQYALRSVEKTVNPTTLSGAMFRHFGVQDPDSLITLFYEQSISRQEIAGFLPFVVECAKQGDSASIEILECQARLFTETILSLLREIKNNTVPVGLWGGVFCHVPIFRNQVIDLLAAQGYTDVHILPVPPEIGAVFLAMRYFGLHPNQRITDNVLRSYPKQEG